MGDEMVGGLLFKRVIEEGGEINALICDIWKLNLFMEILGRN